MQMKKMIFFHTAENRGRCFLQVIRSEYPDAFLQMYIEKIRKYGGVGKIRFGNILKFGHSNSSCISSICTHEDFTDMRFLSF